MFRSFYRLRRPLASQKSRNHQATPLVWESQGIRQYFSYTAFPVTGGGFRSVTAGYSPLLQRNFLTSVDDESHKPFYEGEPL